MSENIATNDFPPVDWDDGKEKLNESLNLVFKWATGEAKAAINYYITKTKWNRRMGWGIRLVSAISVAVAAVLPTISQLLTNSAGHTKLPPVYATLAAAFAAALFGLDRTLGWSNAWIRYMKTAGAIHTLLDGFNLQWSKARSRLSRKGPQVTEIPQMIDLAKEFVDRVNKTIETETKTWISDYKKASAEFAKILEEATGTDGDGDSDGTNAGEPIEITDKNPQAVEAREKARICLIVQGKGTIKVGDKDPEDVDQGDSIDIPAGDSFTITKTSDKLLIYVLAEKETT
ncbi:MAG TPA: SLATT domain-containing protein [Candidatus Anoxymicrobiaceae bacterium]